jgi:formylglycine-generating enzyme required for sulfatase activity
VSTFRLDKYLVTVGRFRQFVNASLAGPSYGKPAVGSGKHVHLNGGRGLANAVNAGTYETGWVAAYDGDFRLVDYYLTCNGGDASWTPSPGSNEKLPMVCETWSEAYAFCIWDGAFLPSEAEWAYAAAGGSQQREYPWGQWDPGSANLYAIYGCNYRGDAGCAGLAPVGTATLGVSRWGQLDMSGEVYEWILDSYYGQQYYPGPCVDCAPFITRTAVVTRGATYVSDVSELLATFRIPGVQGNRGYIGGFRCARSP